MLLYTVKKCVVENDKKKSFMYDKFIRLARATAVIKLLKFTNFEKKEKKRMKRQILCRCLLYGEKSI